MRGQVHINFFQYRLRQTLIANQDDRLKWMGGSAKFAALFRCQF